MVQILDSPKSFGTRFGEGLQESLPDALEKLISRKRHETALNKENEALEKLGIPATGISDPKLREKLLENKVKSDLSNEKLLNNKTILNQIEKDRNLEPGSLSSYISDTKLAEQISRPQKLNESSQPIHPEQLKIIKQVRNSEGFNDLDEVDQYRVLTDAGVSKGNAAEEAKLTSLKLERNQKAFDSAYKAHEDFINDTTNSYKAFETETKPRLLQMRSIPDEDLISPTAAVFLDKLGIPLGSLEDPSSELYHKLSQDLLKGLPETYGSRILKVEVDNFLKTIPTLMNSADGRRMIASNMLKLGEMKEIYYNEMRKQQKNAIDNSKPLPKDFQQRIFDQVKPQIDKSNNEFVKLSQIKSVPENTIPFFSPSGEIEFVPKEHAQWASDNGGKRIW